MVETWLAGKISGLVIFAIACLSIILIPAMVIQTVRINGISFFGWYAVDGYKPMYERDEKDLVILRANQATLSHGLDTCNASVDGIKTASDLLNKNAETLANIAKAGNGQLASNAAAIKAIKSSDEKCPVADSILTRAFQ